MLPNHVEGKQLVKYQLRQHPTHHQLLRNQERIRLSEIPRQFRHVLSGCTTAGLRLHITCCACAHQLLCERTTADARAKILTVSKHILSFLTTSYMIINNFHSLAQQTETFALTTPQLCYFSSVTLIFLADTFFFS